MSGTVNVGTLEAVLSLKDMFSAPLAGALKSLSVGAAIGASLGLVAKAIKDCTKEAMEGEKVLAQLAAGVKSTGGVAGKSVGELDDLSDRLSNLSAVDDELIATGEALLLTFRKVRGEAFDETMKTALDLSARLGGDLQGSVKMLGKALEDPKKGLTALGKAGVQFSDDQKKAIEKLIRTNDLLAAQKIILKEVKTQVGGSAQAYRNTLAGALDTLDIAWGNLKQEIGKSGLALRGPVELLISLLNKLIKVVQYANLGFTVMALNALKVLAPIEIKLREIAVSLSKVIMQVELANPFASQEEKAKVVSNYIETQRKSIVARIELQKKEKELEKEALEQALAIKGIYPKIKEAGQDVLQGLTEEQEKAIAAAEKAIAALKREAEQLEDQAVAATRGLKALEAKKNAQAADNAVLEISAGLAEQNLKLTVDQERAIRSYISRQQEATKQINLQVQALDKLNNIASEVALSSLWHKSTSVKEIGNLVADLQNQMAEKGRQLTEEMLTAEEKRLEVLKEAYTLLLNGNISQETYDRIKLANAEQWTEETTAAYNEYVKIQEKLSEIADELSYALTSTLIDGLREGKLEIKEIGRAIEDVFLNALGDVIQKWLSEWFKAMSSWLARWIATQRAGKVASSIQGPTQSGGNLSDSGATQTAATYASRYAGYALAAYALFVVYKGFIENHKRLFTEVTISNGEISSVVSNTKQNFNDIQKGVQALIDAVKKLISDLNVEATRLGTVIIESSKSGFNVKFSPTSTGQLFKTIEEAMAYAQVLMLKYGDFSDSVSKLVQSVIKATKAMTPEQLSADIDFARTLENQNKSDLAIQMEQDINLAKQQWARAKELFLAFYSRDLPALAESAASIFTRLNGSIRAQFNSLMGIKEDPKKAWQDRVKQFEIEKKLALLQLKLWAQENAARIQNYNIQGRIIGGGGGGGKGGKIGAGGGLLGLAFATLQFASALDVAAGQIDEGLQALLDIQALIEQSIKDINELPTIDPEKDYPGNKGGNRGSNRDNVRQFIKDKNFELSLVGLTDYQKALRELDQQYKTLLEQAGKDKALREQLLALKQKELDLLAKEQVNSIVDKFQEFLGLVSPFDQVRETATDLIKQIESSPMGNDRKARMIGRVLAELDKQLEQLARESSVSLLGEMLGDLEKYGIESKLQDDIRRNMSIFEHNLKMIHYKQEIEALRLSGKITAEQLRQFEDALKAIESAGPYNDGNGTSSGSAYNAKMEAMAKANQEYIDRLKAARDLLKKYQDSSLDSENQLLRSLRQINNDFTTIRSALGNTPEVISAFNSAVKSAFRQALEGVRKFYDSLLKGADSQLTLEQQYEYARREYNRLIAEVTSGDYSEIEKLDSAGQEFISLFGQVYGTSVESFEIQRQAILDQMKQILALGDIPVETPIDNVLRMPLEQTRDNTSENVAATKEVARGISNLNTQHGRLLSSMLDSISSLSESISILASDKKISYG